MQEDPDTWCQQVERNVRKYHKKNAEYTSELKVELLSVNRKYSDLVSTHAHEKAELSNEIKNLKEEVDRLRKARKECPHCSRSLESVLFCNIYCYELSKGKYMQYAYSVLVQLMPFTLFLLFIIATTTQINNQTH